MAGSSSSIKRQIRWTQQRILSIGILLIIINSILCPCVCEDTPSEKRSIDLSSSWRPMHFQQAVPPSHLISISSMDNANRMQLFQIAQYNAQILQRLRDMEAALKRNNIDIHGGKSSVTKIPTAATPTVLPEMSLKQIAQFRSNQNAFRNSIDPAHLMGEQSHPVPATLKQSPQFLHNPNFLKPPFNIHSAASNVVYSAIPHSLNGVPSQHVPKSNSFGTGKPVYYSKYPEAKPQYYSSTPKIPYLIQQSPPHLGAHSSFYRTAASVYRDAPITTPPHPVLNKIHSHLNSYVGNLPPQRHHSSGIVPINGQQHVKIGNASIPMHIISSLSIFGNALQQIRDTTQKETILQHLLRNITTTASSLVPASVATTLASVGAFSTLPPPDAYFKPMHFKPIPVTMPSPTNKSPLEMDSQPTMAIPQRPVYPPVPEVITQRPTIATHYGMGSVKQLPFLPTIPAAEQRPQRVKIMSPLQDANRFAYKTNTPPAVSSSYDNQLFTVTPGKPLSYNLGSTTENNFHIFDNHLNAEFKKIKQQQQQQQFHVKPAKKQNLRIIGDTLTTEKTLEYNPGHSFFTIEDAVTSVPHYYMKNHRGKPPKQQQQQQHRFKSTAPAPTQTADIMSTIQSNLEYFRTVTTTAFTPETTPATTTTTTTTTTSTTTPAPVTTAVQDIYDLPYPKQEPTHIPRHRTKLRRKKPRPHYVNAEQEMDTATSNIVTNSWEYTRHRHRVRGRPSADMVDVVEEAPTESNILENSVTDQPTTKLRERVKFPARHRFADSTTFEPRTRGSTTTAGDKEDQLEDMITTTSLPVTTPSAILDTATSDDHLRQRTRFRYKPRTRPTFATTTTTTTTESPQIEEVNEEENEATDNPMVENEEKMIVGKSGDDSLTTLPPLQQRVKIVKFDTKNRPRFSVKDYRNRQNGTSTTRNEPTSTTPSNNLRTRHKLTKDELENRATKRLSTMVPRRKPIGTRLDINRLKTSSETSTSAETTPATQTVAQTTPMTIKLRNSFRNRDKSRFGVVAADKVNPVENDIPQTDEDELVRSESNHYGMEADAEETKVVEKVTEKNHETSIMKIAKDDHSYRWHGQRPPTTPSALAELMNTIDNESNLLQRVSDLTVTSGQSFANSVNTKHVSRKIPNYFTIATEDPILPIEAFFPNVINKE